MILKSSYRIYKRGKNYNPKKNKNLIIIHLIKIEFKMCKDKFQILETLNLDAIHLFQNIQKQNISPKAILLISSLKKKKRVKN